MVSWAEFDAAAPDLAAAGRRLLYGGGEGAALLATIRGDSPPRVDLERDGRYALHTHQDPAAPSEFAVRGRATLVQGDAGRSAAAAVWYFEVDETYRLFEFSIEAALLGAG